MASKERSPNFPALTLQKALEFASKLHAEAKRTAVKTSIALQAMGYNSVNGRSLGVLAALRAYGLVASDGEATQISDLALRILFPKNDQDAEQAKQQAALSPKLFKSIHEQSGDLSEKMLASALFHQKFTQEGAAKAAQIFHQNRAFTAGQSGLDSASEDADDEQLLDDAHPNVERVHAATTLRTSPAQAPNPFTFQRPMNADALLPIPLEIGDAFIPRGMSEDDFSLLLDSLTLWKRRIVRPEWPKSAVWHNRDSDVPVTLIGPMGERDGQKYYRTSDGTGIPESELSYPA